MPWDRGAWEKTTSRGVPYSKYNENPGEKVNDSKGPAVNVSGGISFCPKCSSMMMERNGILTCSQCGYTKYNQDSSHAINRQNRLKQQNDQQITLQKNKQMMNNVLSYMFKGKTRYQASKLANVPLSSITHWYNEGKAGNGKDNIHFYHEILAIEKNQEIRRREEINRQNRLKEQKRKQKQRETKQRIEKIELNIIKKQMDEIVKQMKNGETRFQAAINVGVPIYTVNEWFDEGWRTTKEPYTSFYTKVNAQEIRQKKVKNSNKITHSSRNNLSDMERIVKEMKKGLTRIEATNKLNISVISVNNWYNKGSHGHPNYVKFYDEVKRIENSRKKDKSSYNFKSTTSNMITCPKCGKKYNKKYYEECPNCRKSTNQVKSSSIIKNSSNKIKSSSNVKKSTNQVKSSNKVKTSNFNYKSSTNVKKSNDEWIKCCIAIFFIFLFMSIFGGI